MTQTYLVAAGTKYHEHSCSVPSSCVSAEAWTPDEIAQGFLEGSTPVFRKRLRPCDRCGPPFIRQWASVSRDGKAGVATISLTDFLLARMDEDEAAALDSIPGPWVAGALPGHLTRDVGPDHVVSGDVAVMNPRTLAHVVRHDPARVLADCEAKRRIVAESESAAVAASLPRVTTMNQVLRALALPYADHPDYDERWRP